MNTIWQVVHESFQPILSNIIQEEMILRLSMYAIGPLPWKLFSDAVMFSLLLRSHRHTEKAYRMQLPSKNEDSFVTKL